MKFPWCSHDIPMIFPWYSHDVPMIFPWYSHDIPIVGSPRYVWDIHPSFRRLPEYVKKSFETSRTRSFQQMLVQTARLLKCRFGFRVKMIFAPKGSMVKHDQFCGFIGAILLMWSIWPPRLGLALVSWSNRQARFSTKKSCNIQEHKPGTCNL